MKNGILWLLAVVLLTLNVACGGGGGGGNTEGPFTLTVTAPSNGTIALNPTGGSYAAGTVVTVTATPASGYDFTAWTGALSGTTNPTTVTMNGNKTVGATFTAQGTGPYTLTVTAPTNGTITLNPSGGSYAAGTVVTVTAAPASGYDFTAWTGALSGTTNPTTVTMTGNKTVGATFTLHSTGDECTNATNAAEKTRLLAAQPVFGVRSKQAITAATTFPSKTGSASCPITLSFKDSNGNGTLDAYENWTLTAAARTTDLLARMPAAEKLALLAHPVTTDVPATGGAVSSALATLITSGVRFGESNALTATVLNRATWANKVQEAAEATSLGVPFLLSSEPAHSGAGGRVKARSFSQWPSELSLAAAAASDTTAGTTLKAYGQIVAQELKAIGIRLVLSAPADLATDPRWYGAQFTFGEDKTAVSAALTAYLQGLQGTALGSTSVAAAVSHFPGAGATDGGFDARLAKGKYTNYAGNKLDDHLAPFQAAITAGAKVVVTGYGIPKTGPWTAASGAISGTSIEQVGASFNGALVNTVLRGSLGFTGLVVAPLGVLDDAGQPWGVESLTKAARIKKAVGAGVDQFIGLSDLAALTSAGLTSAEVDAAAGRALSVLFGLGLFENPYVDAAVAASKFDTDTTKQTRYDTLDRGLILLVNVAKPTGFLNGNGDGTQTSDPGNAGNGTGKILPAPPGQVYVAPGCTYYVAGDFDLDYVRSVSAGYGTMTNDVTVIGTKSVCDASESDCNGVKSKALKMAYSDYVFVRVAAPFTADPDAVAYDLPTGTLTWGSNAATVLAPVAAARAGIDQYHAIDGANARAQLVVFVDAGHLPVLDELMAYNPGGVYLGFGATDATQPDKFQLDVGFGIVKGVGKLPVGLPLSDAAAATQNPDQAGDGQHATFVRGFGLQTTKF